VEMYFELVDPLVRLVTRQDTVSLLALIAPATVYSAAQAAHADLQCMDLEIRIPSSCQPKMAPVGRHHITIRGPWPMLEAWVSGRSDDDCRGAAAAVANPSDAVAATTLLQHTEQRDDDARSAAADGMPECHRAPQDVDLLRR